MPDYQKRSLNYRGDPVYTTAHYKKRNRRKSKKARKATRSGHAASSYSPRSSSSTFFSALAIPRK